MSKQEFEKYPALTEMIEQYASTGKFSSWTAFLSELNKCLKEQQLSDSKYDNLEKQVVELLGITHSLNVLEVIEKIKPLFQSPLPAGTTVYVPIEIKEGCELPTENNKWHAVIIDNRWESALKYFIDKGFCDFDPNKGWEKIINATHWLKETTIPDYESLSAQIENLQDQVIKEQEESKKLREEIAKYGDIAKAMMGMSDELVALRKENAELKKNQL